MTRRVVITGAGLVSCLGHDEATVLSALRRGQSGVRAMPPEWREHGLKSLIAGMIENLDGKKLAANLSKKLTPGMSYAALYCAIAARDAVDQAGLGETELEKLYEFDVSFLNEISGLEGNLASIPDPGEGDPAAALGQAATRLTALEDQWAGRSNVISDVIATTS